MQEQIQIQKQESLLKKHLLDFYKEIKDSTTKINSTSQDEVINNPEYEPYLRTALSYIYPRINVSGGSALTNPVEKAPERLKAPIENVIAVYKKTINEGPDNQLIMATGELEDRIKEINNSKKVELTRREFATFMHYISNKVNWTELETSLKENYRVEHAFYDKQFKISFYEELKGRTMEQAIHHLLEYAGVNYPMNKEKNKPYFREEINYLPNVRKIDLLSWY